MEEKPAAPWENFLSQFFGLAGKGLVWPEQAIWMMQSPKHLLRWFICHSVIAVLALKDPPLSLPCPSFTSPSSHILQQ